MFLAPLTSTLSFLKTPVIKSALVLLSFFSLLACSKPQAINNVAFKNQVSVSISAQRQYHLDQPIKVSFIIKNGTKKPIQLLKWGTPLEGQLTRNSFKITYKNKELPYLGRLSKRAKPSNKDFTTLQALTSQQTELTLNSYYNFSQPGEYTLTYRPSFLNIGTPSNKVNSSLVKLNVSNSINFSVTK